MSFKLQIVQEIEEDNLQLRNPQRLMAFKIEQLLLNGSENSVTLIGKPNTIYYVKVARTKIMELEAKVKLLETEVFWNDRPLLQIKKQSFLI
jgi:hypothetical protein